MYRNLFIHLLHQTHLPFPYTVLSPSYLLHQNHISMPHNNTHLHTTPYSHLPPSATSHSQHSFLLLNFNFTQRCDIAESCCSTTQQYHSELTVHTTLPFSQRYYHFLLEGTTSLSNQQHFLLAHSTFSSKISFPH